MGYTHYWHQKRDLTEYEWLQLRGAFARLLVRLPHVGGRPLEISGPLGTGEPINNDTEIAFNGKAPELDHESFCLDLCKRERSEWEDPKDYANDGAFSFCKTNRKPYDILVCAMLVIAEHVTEGAIAVKSDGDPDDWANAYEWLVSVMPEPMPLPRFIVDPSHDD